MNITSVTVMFDDGNVQTINAAPIVAPTDVEIDVQLSDGSTRVFIPKV